MATPTTLPATFVAGNVLTAAQMNDLRGAFRVLQVVSTTKTDTFTTTSVQTFTDITGLSATITPSATSSKIFVIANIWGSNDVAVANSLIRLMRDSTPIFVGDAAGSRAQAQTFYAQSNFLQASHMLSTLDSPATTSAITYKVQLTNDNASTAYVNRTKNDTNSWLYARSASSITVMEISA